MPPALTVIPAAHPLEVWHAVVLGLVEGITEYLPISSTGHLIIANALMGLDTPDRKSAVDAFVIVIQGGAILAVLSLYWPHVLRMLKGFLGKDAQGLRLALNLIIAFIPAAIFGKLLDDWIESKLFSAGPVLLALALGGIYMMVVDQWQAGKVAFLPKHSANTETVYDLSWKQSLFVGCMQCIAMWPGTSRSMMTITGGVLAGMKPRQAAEFSFLLGLPTLGAATLYKAYKNVSHAHATNTPNMFEQLGWTPVIVGTLVAAVSAFFAVKWLVGFLNKHGLTPFGWYRLALCAVLLVLAWRGIVTIGPPMPGAQGTQPATSALPAQPPAP
ncbi:MAG TPA: undecaprenyl-diphosphate phosphatase [Phycisphaerales bacterium]|nr:undecaprenyl-diphosphate phosphatase [Phycisphaerales bacterium]